MKQTVNFTSFHYAFQAIRPDNFSYGGLHALFEYLEQYEEDIGEELELDVIALCCKYSEYTLDEIKRDYGYLYDAIQEAEELEEVTEILQDYTTVIPVNDECIIIQDF